MRLLKGQQAAGGKRSASQPTRRPETGGRAVAAACRRALVPLGAALLAGTFLTPLAVPAANAQGVNPELGAPPEGSPVNVVADKITYDSRREIATATGLVKITYGPYVLNATKVVYDKRNDTLRANGDIMLREPNGNMLLADIAELRNRFREGFAEHLKLLLTNRAVLTADYAQRQEGGITVYERVAYTACNACVMRDGTPVWQIKSREAVHDENEHTITHKDATFEMFGVPVAYAPTFWHADPTVKRQSGFLTPRLITSSEYGFGLEVPYYWALAPNYDITFRPTLTTKQGPLLRAEWRHRLEDGEYSIDAGGIYQLDTDIEAPGDRHFRGFVRTEGDFRINERWNWGWDITATTDDTFMRRYKIDSRTQLTSQVYLTGIDDRNYFNAAAYHFRGLLKNDDSDTTPYVAPSIRHSFTFDQPVLGGEFGVDTNIYSLHRDDPTVPYTTVDQGTEATRVVTQAHWKRRMVTNMGQVITPFANLRGDVYYTDKVPDASVPGGLRDEEVTGRLLPSAGLDLRWPFVRSDALGQHVFEPVAQVIASVNEYDTDRLPNEDSITFNLDHTNLFLHDRFTGLDRYEGGTRANLGFVYTLLTNSGGFAKFSFGQSFHLAGRNSFTVGSGLEGSTSDLVAALALQPIENIRMTYSARFDDKTLDVNAQEIGLVTRFDRLTASVNYVDVARAPSYGRVDTSEQVWASASVDLFDGWRIFGGFRYDLEEDRKLRNLVGIGWDCDCMSVSLAYEEDFTSDRDVEPDRSILLSVDFRTLGGAGVSTSVD